MPTFPQIDSLPSPPCPRPRIGRVRARGGFTLIEIVLAVVVLIIITVVVYDFTDTTLASARFSVELADHDAAYGGMRRLIENQLASLATSEAGSLGGVRVQPRNGPRRDILQLICPAGNALLSADARGLYQVSLSVRESPRGSGKFFLGLQREPWAPDDDDEDVEDANGNPVPNAGGASHPPKASLPADWIPLMEGVTGLEVSYFDSRANGWVDQWPDQSALPNLVRLRLQTAASQPPYEIVARVPAGGPRRALTAPVVMPALTRAGAGGVGGQSQPNNLGARGVGAGGAQNPLNSPNTGGPGRIVNPAN